jgi:hypothetical protein
LDHFNNIDYVAVLCTALDMVVSTKTTVPLISAAVGTSTKLAKMNPVGPLVKKFERNTFEPWDDIFHLIAQDVFKLIAVDKAQQNNIIQNTSKN